MDRLIYDAEGESSKRFHVKDGLGLRLLSEQGYAIAVVSARGGPALERPLARARDYVGCACHPRQASRPDGGWRKNSASACPSALSWATTCGIYLPARGGILRQRRRRPPAVCGVRSNYVTQEKGGLGAVREVADLLLAASGKLEAAVDELLAAKSSAGFGVVIPSALCGHAPAGQAAP
jgi:3-deoxy-D-manno-octulosonate 8-phosphate phosphatase (KDO 8-P phosphatase)